MRNIIFLFLFLFSALNLNAKEKFPGAGELQLGLRSTSSFFGDSGYMGFGSGGQFRLRLSKMLNTEWFSDYIITNIGDLGKRVDGHIGWSVMFYMMDDPDAHKIRPYFLAGHCFDYTKVTPFSTYIQDRSGDSKYRWSSATQAGMGVHFFIGEKFNISLSSQYMLHLGRDIHADVITVNGVKELSVSETTKHDNTLEGHLLTTLSLNIRLADLW